MHLFVTQRLQRRTRRRLQLCSQGAPKVTKNCDAETCVCCAHDKTQHWRCRAFTRTRGCCGVRAYKSASRLRVFAMPKKGSGSVDVPATPEALLKAAEAALESGERRQRSGEDAKAIAYFQTVCSTLAGMKDDRQGCLLWATAMANLVELGATSWSGLGSMDGAPDLRLAASALEQGHAAAVAASAPSSELAHLLIARAECAGLLVVALSLAADWAAAVYWAGEAAQLWQQALTQELATSAAEYEVPEATVETLCGLGSASMAFGKLALGGDGAKAGLDAATRRAAQAAVKRALDAYEKACALCDSAYAAPGPTMLRCTMLRPTMLRPTMLCAPCRCHEAGCRALVRTQLIAFGTRPIARVSLRARLSRRGDDLPDVLAQWAQALWDASELVPSQKRVEPLRRAVDRAATSVRLQKIPIPEASCLLGDLLIALAEAQWKEWKECKGRRDSELSADGGSGEVGAGLEAVGAVARKALWHCRRAWHDGYAEARRVRGDRDLSVLCSVADALLDCGRLQREMLACGVDLVVAQPAAMVDASSATGPPDAPTTARPAYPSRHVPTHAAQADATDLSGAVDQMCIDEAPLDVSEEAPMELVLEPPAPPASLPPLPSASECLERAASSYQQALEGGSVADWAAARVSRHDTIYNAACASALCGGRDEECAKLLSVLAVEGALRRAELEGDADLAPLVPTAWMQSLLSTLPS